MLPMTTPPTLSETGMFEKYVPRKPPRRRRQRGDRPGPAHAASLAGERAAACDSTWRYSPTSFRHRIVATVRTMPILSVLVATALECGAMALPTQPHARAADLQKWTVHDE